MTSESKTDYQRDEQDEMVSRFLHNPTYTISFNTDKPIDIEEFHRVMSIDTSNMPDAYDIQYMKIVQARKHKKRRINKKWLKRYGYKQVIVKGKGWKIKRSTDGNVEFIK